jgi:hypothetical protein
VFEWHKRFVQGRDSLEDGEHTSWPRKVRTELEIQDVAMLVHVNHSKMGDKIAAGISHGTCHNILSDDLNVSRVTQHSVAHVLMQHRCDDRMSTCGDLINSADKDGTFHNRRRNMVFSVCSVTEVTSGHLEIAIICKKEEIMTGQVKRQGKCFSSFFLLIWYCLHGIYPRRSDCKQAPLQGDPSPSTQFQYIVYVPSFGAGGTCCCYTTAPFHITLCLCKRSWQNNKSPFCHSSYSPGLTN